LPEILPATTFPATTRFDRVPIFVIRFWFAVLRVPYNELAVKESVTRAFPTTSRLARGVFVPTPIEFIK